MGDSKFHSPAATSGHNRVPISNGAITGMERGVNEFSYTRNSRTQFRAIELILKPVMQQEISQLKLLTEGESSLRLVNVADLGCSVGDNTLRIAELVLDCIQNRNGASWDRPPDIQYFFSDLPTNDFNTLFHQLEDWKSTRLAGGGKFYPAAAPGSFYKRLFPPGSLHIVTSTVALHYLSQVPDAVTDKASAAYNKHRVFIPKSPLAVAEAYAERSKQDLFQFVSCRAEEVASGGLVVLYFPARVDEEHPENPFEPHLETMSAWGTIFEDTWKTLAMEGTISEEEWNSFNVPSYMASMGEVRAAVTATDAFHIKQMKVEEFPHFDDLEERQLLADPEAYGRYFTKFIQALLRSYIVNHIGQESGDKFFQRMTEIAATAAREKRITRLAAAAMLLVLIRK